jgi:hypothetical protein
MKLLCRLAVVPAQWLVNVSFNHGWHWMTLRAISVAVRLKRAGEQ